MTTKSANLIQPMTIGFLAQCVCLIVLTHSSGRSDAFVTQSSPAFTGFQSISRVQSSRLIDSARSVGPVFYDDFSEYKGDNEDNEDEDEEDEEDDEEDYEDEDDEDEDDDEIDPDTLGNWRDFRRSLASSLSDEPRKAVSSENQALLETQSKALASEYKEGVWAHETSTAELGGLIVRMPLESEISKNFKLSMIGAKLRKRHESKLRDDDIQGWFLKAKDLVEEEMQNIASKADENGHIDATTLSEESTEMLQLYLDNQENWQEVCLVLEKNPDGSAMTVVINRPMAMKLTENLSRLVLYGSFQSDSRSQSVKVDLVKFLLAFGQECAVYVGGGDNQDQPAILLHGIADLDGAEEISPGAGIYRGGLEAAIDGVICGKYKPLDFRFFIGCHTYEESTLDLTVALGKYQPVACARSLVLKQCISLPKPLWHEVLETCGDTLAQISQLELLKRDDATYQVIDEDDDDEYEIIDELDELETFDDDEDDYCED